MSPWITLDKFCWTLSNSSHKKQKNHHSAINDYSGSSSKSYRLSQAKSNVPSLTKDSGSSSRLSAPSVLSNNVKIISRECAVKVETEPGLSNDSDGGLSDNDEIMGEEREVAINSPIKGKKRVTSEVSFFIVCLIQ
jgi:hypothetical protein